MTVRFDDSLPTLANVIATELGESALSSGVALRDATGMLAFFSSLEVDDATIDRVTGHLRADLGSYARSDRVFADVRDYGVKELLDDPIIIRVIAGRFTIRLIDRRLVGIDWLHTPAPVAAPPPRFVFSSIKGGVGRTTALSVAAASLAQRGRRVLAVDLDIEAPGLGAILLDEGTTPDFGLVDALVESKVSTLDEQFFLDLVGPATLAGRHGRIDVIPAFGKRSIRNPADVLAKISRAYTDEVREDGTSATILDRVSELISRFANPARYDAILVDARAGLHETAASAILGLGAEVFLFGLDDAQTFQGYAALLAHLARFVDPASPRPEWLDRLTMVQGKAPADASYREGFEDKCRSLFSDAGLNPESASGPEVVLMPAEPFSNVPWEEDDAVIEIDDTSDRRRPVAILDDERFRNFAPLHRRDQITEEIYQLSYGVFLERIEEPFLDGKREAL